MAVPTSFLEMDLQRTGDTALSSERSGDVYSGQGEICWRLLVLVSLEEMVLFRLWTSLGLDVMTGTAEIKPAHSTGRGNTLPE